LTNPYVRALAVSGTNLFAGTGNGGVWRRPLSEMITSVERLSTDLPTHFSLDQNYPNPFSARTTIRFKINPRSDEGRLISLRVFDFLGREVATLVDGEVEPGEYNIEFDILRNPLRGKSTTDIRPGLYFYRLTTPSFSHTKSMVLMR
jgi:hypothetical protein